MGMRQMSYGRPVSFHDHLHPATQVQRCRGAAAVILCHLGSYNMAAGLAEVSRSAGLNCKHLMMALHCSGGGGRQNLPAFTATGFVVTGISWGHFGIFLAAGMAGEITRT